MKNYYVLKTIALISMATMMLWGGFAYAVYDRPTPPPILKITSTSPVVAKTGNNFTLTVNGAGFTKNSYIRIYQVNNPDAFVEMPADFVSSTKVTFEMPLDLLSSGMHYVQVFNQNNNYDIIAFSNITTFIVTP